MSIYHSASDAADVDTDRPPCGAGQVIEPELARGRTSWERPATPYEEFIEYEGVPVYRAVDGIRDVRELSLGHWDRLDCDGAYVQLRGLGGLQGTAVIRIPPRGHVAPERHMYEEVFYVLEGEGATEIRTHDHESTYFGWRAGDLFIAPLNTWHELTNASSAPAIIIAVNSAPPVMHMYRSRSFVFENEWQLDAPLAQILSEFARPQANFDIEPRTERAFYTSAYFPGANTRELPVDGQRGTGYRHVELQMGGNVHEGFIGEYLPLSYGKTHTHRSGPMLICMDGEGYTLTWPDRLGTTPWRDGHADLIRRIEYREGGLMSPVPGGDAWFHGHYNALDRPLRMLAHIGAYPRVTPGDPGDVFIDTNAPLKEGGGTIAYEDEDPAAKAIFDSMILGGALTVPAATDLEDTPAALVVPFASRGE